MQDTIQVLNLASWKEQSLPSHFPCTFNASSIAEMRMSKCLFDVWVRSTFSLFLSRSFYFLSSSSCSSSSSSSSSPPPTSSRDGHQKLMAFVSVCVCLSFFPSLPLSMCDLSVEKKQEQNTLFTSIHHSSRKLWLTSSPPIGKERPGNPPLSVWARSERRREVKRERKRKRRKRRKKWKAGPGTPETRSVASFSLDLQGPSSPASMWTAKASSTLLHHQHNNNDCHLNRFEYPFILLPTSFALLFFDGRYTHTRLVKGLQCLSIFGTFFYIQQPFSEKKIDFFFFLLHPSFTFGVFFF